MFKEECVVSYGMLVGMVESERASEKPTIDAIS